MATGSVAALRGPGALASRLARTDVLVLGGIVLLGAWLRFRHLGLQSYWFDESVTVQLVDKPFGQMIDAIPASESTPPLYYVLAGWWTRVFGVSEDGLRSLSVVMGVATLPLVWAAGWRLVGSRVGLVAAGPCAVSPTLVWYSQEARSYALMAFFGALSFLFFVGVGAGERAASVRVGACVRPGADDALLQRVPHPARGRAPAVALPALAALGRDRGDRRGGRRRCGAPSPGPSPGGQRAHGLDRRQRPRIAHQADRAGACDRGHSLHHHGHPPALAVEPSGDRAPGRRGAILLWRGDARERSGAGLAAIVGVAAILAPLGLALTPLDFFQDRNLLAAWIPLSVATGAAFAVRRAAPLGLLAAGVLATTGVWVDHRVAREPGLQRADWRGLAGAIGPPSQSQAIQVHPSFNAAPGVGEPLTAERLDRVAPELGQVHRASSHSGRPAGQEPGI